MAMYAGILSSMDELILKLGVWFQYEGITEKTTVINDEQHIALRLILTTWFREQLSSQGMTEPRIKQEYRKLAFLFHPDRQNNLDKSLRLANALLQQDSQAPLFACLLYTKELLLQHIENLSKPSEQQASKRDIFNELIQHLTQRAEKTRFEGKRKIMLQVVDMLKSYQRKAKDKRYEEASISLVARGFPFAITAFCVMSYMPQCLALLAVTKIAHLGGEYMADLDGAPAKHIGETLKRTSEHLQKAGLGIFSAVIASYLDGVRMTGNALKQVWLLEEGTSEPASCRLQNPDIEKIARPLVVYLDEVKKQWGLSLRQGHKKQQLISEVLKKIKTLDDAQSPDWPAKLKTLLDELTLSPLLADQQGKCAQRVHEALTRFHLFIPLSQDEQALVLRN